MNKVYSVFHCYDVDGGFGDAIRQEDLVMTFETREDAEAFVERFGKPHVYDKPYHYLYCGELYIDEIEVIARNGVNFDDVDTEEFWWLRNKVYED